LPFFWAAGRRCEDAEVSRSPNNRSYRPAAGTNQPYGKAYTPKKETGKEAPVRENEDLWTKVKKLERHIEAGDGSPFDLRRDAIESIVDVIAGNVPLGRFERVRAVRNAGRVRFAASPTRVLAARSRPRPHIREGAGGTTRA
jgi:hypothetical protein